MNHRYLTGWIVASVFMSAATARAQSPPESERPALARAPAGPAATPPAPEPANAADPGSSDGWKFAPYGFIELDTMRDSTQSFGDSQGNGSILRSDGSSPAYLPLGTNPLGVTYGSTHPRMIFTPRNTQLGARITVPQTAGMKITGVVEVDFFGNQPGSPFTTVGAQGVTTQSSFFSSASVRMRHAYVKIESSVVDLIAGQYYGLFGWQPLYFPAAVAFLGLPNEIFGRTPQVRLSKTIETGPLNVQLAAAALRPPQADGALPDLHGALRLAANRWKGAHMVGAGQANLDPPSIGLSYAYRRLRVAEYQNNMGDPTIATQVAEANAFGISVDALVPVIPIRDLDDKSNALTLTGSFVTGSGIGDLFTGGLTGGAPYPRPEGPSGPFTGFYAANIDPGIVMFDANGTMRLINWRAFMVGLQYYLPVLHGRIIIAGNFTRAVSDNLQQQSTPDFATEKNAGGDPTRTFKESDYYDANVFVEITSALKAGFSWQHTEQVFLATGLAGQEVMSDSREKNDRFEISGWLFF